MLDESHFHSALDRTFAFEGFEADSAAQDPVPHQSRQARFPGSTLAAADLGVSRGHLHAVLSGVRESASLTTRWKAWLAAHPEFAALQRSTTRRRKATA